ncbi:MAG: PilZ domain-containing protein [Suilimivivens sp.]|nr:PilZ domain-containing protein [Lachnospiraceae bacterium]
MEERRKNNRLELGLTLCVKRLDNDENKELKIEVTDVSKTGIGFCCDELLEIGSVYEAFLEIWTKEVIHSFIEIIRMEKKGQLNSYGAVFIGMSETDASRIEVYDTVENLKRS